MWLKREGKYLPNDRFSEFVLLTAQWTEINSRRAHSADYSTISTNGENGISLTSFHYFTLDSSVLFLA